MKLKELKTLSGDYDTSEQGKIMNKRLKRIFGNGCICIGFSILVVIYNILAKLSWYEYIMPLMLTIAGIIFIYKSITIKIKEVNTFNYYQKNKSKKK